MRRRKKELPEPIPVFDAANLALSILQGVQWGAEELDEGGRAHDACPWCGNSRMDGHASYCKLHKAIQIVERSLKAHLKSKTPESPKPCN